MANLGGYEADQNAIYALNERISPPLSSAFKQPGPDLNYDLFVSHSFFYVLLSTEQIFLPYPFNGLEKKRVNNVMAFCMCNIAI